MSTSWRQDTAHATPKEITAYKIVGFVKSFIRTFQKGYKSHLMLTQVLDVDYGYILSRVQTKVPND